MENKVKIGDRVRVSNRLPSFYRLYNSMAIFEQTYNVFAIEDGLALLDSIPHKYVTAIPLKYLIKVIEPKFKVGDKIRVCDPNLSCFGFVGNVTKVKDGLIFATAGNVIDFTAKESCLELVQSKEQVEADADDTAEHCDIPDLSELDRIRVREFIETHPFELTSLESGGKVFEDMYWRDYEADLAKDVALKVINKFDAPHEAAEYAVSVAKAVVEGLKRK